jgi:hypothetical protein
MAWFFSRKVEDASERTSVVPLRECSEGSPEGSEERVSTATPLLTPLMGGTSSLDLTTGPLEYGMPRLVLQLAILWRGLLARCGPLLTPPMRGTSPPDPTTAPFTSGMPRLVPQSAIRSRGTHSVRSVAYSPDGRYIISGSSDCTIRIWDAETGAAPGNPLEGHTYWWESFAYSPDGRHVISGSDDCTIRIWDVKTSAAVGNPLKGHTGWVQSLAYSPDGRHITAGFSDWSIRIWDVETGVAVGSPLEGHAHPAQPIAYSPDGQYVVSGSHDNIMHAWDGFPGLSIRPSSCKPMHPSFRAKLDPDGWVRDSEGGLLYWVPQDCRNGLHLSPHLTIPVTSPTRSVFLEFDEFAFGTSWTQIFKSTPP